MNKKQWIVLGLGLLLIPIFFLFTNLTSKDCSDINEMNNLIKSVDNTNLDIDAQLSSCYEQVIIIRNISAVCWILGFSFFICSGLEPKKLNK